MTFVVGLEGALSARRDGALVSNPLEILTIRVGSGQ